MRPTLHQHAARVHDAALALGLPILGDVEREARPAGGAIDTGDNKP
jgi:hypothetical protein